MAGYSVTDLRHMEEAAFDPGAPAPARRLALYLARVVEAGTAGPSGETIPTPLPCRRRPGRKPCPGRLLVRRLEVPPEIHWLCPSCGDGGLITGWRGGLWDFTGKRFFPLQEEDPVPVGVLIPEEEYRVLKEHVITVDANTDRVVASARRSAAGVRLAAPAEELEELLGCVAFEANHTGNRRHRTLLDRLSDRIDDALSG